MQYHIVDLATTLSRKQESIHLSYLNHPIDSLFRNKYFYQIFSSVPTLCRSPKLCDFIPCHNKDFPIGLDHIYGLGQVLVPSYTK